MRAKLLTASLFVAAALANLPIVYGVIADGALSPPVALLFGLLSMGLGWAAGFLIEGRKRWFVITMGALGVAEALLVLVPLDPSLGAEVRPYLVATGALSAVGLALAVGWREARA